MAKEYSAFPAGTFTMCESAVNWSEMNQGGKTPFSKVPSISSHVGASVTIGSVLVESALVGHEHAGELVVNGGLGSGGSVGQMVVVELGMGDRSVSHGVEVRVNVGNEFVVQGVDVGLGGESVSQGVDVGVEVESVSQGVDVELV